MTLAVMIDPTQLDLFGEYITQPWPLPFGIRPAKRIRHRKSPVPMGYARLPGHGPPGETCRTCERLLLVRLARGKAVYKCGANRANHTHGRSSDILLRSPACILWTQGYQSEDQSSAPFIDRLKD